MKRHSYGILLLYALVLTGCATQRLLVEQQAARIAQLEDSLAVLRDSLAFYDYIDSGQYAQDLRSLYETIDRLRYELAVCRDGGLRLAVELADDLFAPASAVLTDRGRQRLDALARRLHQFPEHRIRIEGYTDNVPIGARLKDRFPSNWELAAARAAAVARYFIDVHGLNPERLEVVSYGPTHPIGPNDTAEGRRLNRRVVIRAMPPLRKIP
ncbi:OmpA/MotB family protein [Rhodothermus profundi]|uniref:Chemotaxis protein MotB n=1 Tax=Rhodothermus profundi TaxID=633813 RepID=A0A1M6TXR9_9BACT|nr:OmpA family protein [Rhodothermus profundi]SHK61736.1 chemotaxis protein MotB [Rhodothermus profundi]